MSVYWNRLHCPHCSKTHSTRKWPINGDWIPFYYQKKPGNYNLEVTCPYCEKDWYVVWDRDPGLIRQII